MIAWNTLRVGVVAIHTGYSGLDRIGQETFLEEGDLYLAFVSELVQVAGAELGFLHLCDPATGDVMRSVWTESVLKVCDTQLVDHPLVVASGLWRNASKTRAAVIENAADALPIVSSFPDSVLVISNYLSLPIIDNGAVVGVIGIANRPGGFDAPTVESLERMIRVGWPVVRNRTAQMAQEQMEQMTRYFAASPTGVLTGMMVAMGKALELRDQYTASHQANVSHICGLIAARMGMTDFRRNGLLIAASIHDIGKIAVPVEILAKPGRLSDVEMDLIRAHPAVGAKVFEDVDSPWKISDMIAQHHERMDGSGYPGGLTGPQICLEARIIAVADTFDAIATDRPYRAAPGIQFAADVIRAGRLGEFDAYVVDAFFDCLKMEPTFGGRYVAGDPAKISA